MRKMYLIMMQMCIFGSIIGQQPLPPKGNSAVLPIIPGATFNFNVIVENRQEARADNSTKVATAQIAKRSESSPILDKLAELRPDLIIPQSIKDQLSGKTNFFDRYKWHLTGSALLASYALVCYIIIRGNSYLGKNELWSSWHQELTLEQILAIPQQQFSQELIREIQRRYNEPASLTDIIQPLTKFMKAIENEEEQIRWYQNAYSWITYLYLDRIAPFSKQRFNSTMQRLQRITYFKNVFQSWAAQYQMEHTARSILTMMHDEKDVTHIAALMHAVHKAKMLYYMLQEK